MRTSASRRPTTRRAHPVVRLGFDAVSSCVNAVPAVAGLSGADAVLQPRDRRERTASRAERSHKSRRRPGVCLAAPGNWKLRSATPTMVNGSRRQAARWVPSPREEFRITVRPMTSGDAANDAAPEALADDQRRRGVVRAIEPAAQSSALHASVEKNSSETVANSTASVRPFGRHHALIGCVERDRLECVDSPDDVEIFQREVAPHRLAHTAHGRVPLPRGQADRAAVWQRAQENAVNEAEEARIGADANASVRMIASENPGLLVSVRAA